MMLLFMSGFHTSAWILLYLHFSLPCPASWCPRETLFSKEIEQKVGDDRNEKMKSYITKSNSYLQQVQLNVSWYTTASFSAHYSDKDIMVDCHCVPASIPIIHALGVVMNNKAIWECPERFNPDRFAPGSRHAKRGYEYRPFGVSNIRRCPANQFTYMMISVFVTILVHSFTLRITDGQNIEKVYGIATSPKNDPLLQVELRHQHL